MKHEIRLKLISSYYLASCVFLVIVIFILYNYEILSENYLYSSLGTLVAFVLAYLLANSKVRIEINDEQLTIYYSGMVQGNIDIKTILSLREKEQGEIRGVEVETNDGRKYFMPLSCFKESIEQEIISELDNLINYTDSKTRLF